MSSSMAQCVVNAIRYGYQISAAARLAVYRPTALNLGPVHNAIVYRAPVPA